MSCGISKKKNMKEQENKINQTKDYLKVLWNTFKEKATINRFCRLCTEGKSCKKEKAVYRSPEFLKRCFFAVVLFIKHSPDFLGASLWLIPCFQDASALSYNYLQTLFKDLYLIFSKRLPRSMTNILLEYQY